MSMLHVHVQAACSYPGCMTISRLHDHIQAACPCPCLDCIPMCKLYVHVQAICLCSSYLSKSSCCMSMLHTSVLHEHAAWTRTHEQGHRHGHGHRMTWSRTKTR
jgi:hypothetical protein